MFGDLVGLINCKIKLILDLKSSLADDQLLNAGVSKVRRESGYVYLSVQLMIRQFCESGYAVSECIVNDTAVLLLWLDI